MFEDYCIDLTKMVQDKIEQIVETVDKLTLRGLPDDVLLKLETEVKKELQRRKKYYANHNIKSIKLKLGHINVREFKNENTL